MTKDEHSKVYTFDHLIEHLNKAVKDPRKRERIRAMTAKSHINDWYKEGENDFERRNSTKGS